MVGHRDVLDGGEFSELWSDDPFFSKAATLTGGQTFGHLSVRDNPLFLVSSVRSTGSTGKTVVKYGDFAHVGK